jgi:hypothetical protein
MFAGHVGAALAIARIEPPINVGWVVAASLWLDIVLWLLVLLGVETVEIPADFASTHQPRFVFPFSHSLAGGIGWSLLAGLMTFGAIAPPRAARWRAAALIAAAVFSHWLLDALVHRPEMPWAGAGSPLLGLGLWDRMPVALALESALLLVGLAVYLPASRLPRGRSIALAGTCLAILVFSLVGMTVAPPPPSPAAMAASSLAAIVGVCAALGWMARRPSRTASPSAPAPGTR